MKRKAFTIILCFCLLVTVITSIYCVKSNTTTPIKSVSISKVNNEKQTKITVGIEELNYNDYKIVKVDNLSIYLNSKSNINKEQYIREMLCEVGVDNKLVAKLSNKLIESFADSKSVIIQKNFWDGEIIDEGETQYGGGDFYIYTALLDKDKTVVQNGITYNVYEAVILADWYLPPFYRLSDTLALTASNGVVYGPSSERYGNAYLTYTDSSDNVIEQEYELYDNRSDNILSEYSDYNFAMRINLPDDVYGIGGVNFREYEEMSFTLGTTLYAKEAFNLYSAYGHKYIAGQASITSDPGFGITFSSATYNYSGIMLSSI